MPRQPPRASRRVRFLRWVKTHYSTRLHMTVILLIVVLTGLLTSRLLLWIGLRSMPVRYGLVVLLCYGVFFGAVRLWIWAVHHGADDEDVTDLLGEVAEDVSDLTVDVMEASSGDLGDLGAEAAEAGESAADVGKTATEGIGALFEGADEGIVAVVIVVVLVAVVLLLLSAGIWVVWEAPLILSEAAAEVVLVASLRRPTREVVDINWVGSVLRTTWRQALIALIVAVAAGAILAALCPGACKASDAVRMCVLS